MRKLIKFFQLAFREKQLLSHAIYLLILYRITIKTKQLQLLLRTVDKYSSQNLSEKSPLFSPFKIKRFLVSGSKFVPYTTCLSEALAGHVLFSKHGYLTKLHIGVLKKNNLTVEAHAWLSLNDSVILGHLPNLEKYREFPLPSLRDHI